MNKSVSLLSTLFTIVLFAGCVSSTSVPNNPKQAEIERAANAINNAPDWIKNPIVENGIAAVGVSRYSSGGMSFMLPQAEADGVAKLATRVREEVSRLQQQSKRLTQTKELDVFDDNFKEATEILLKHITISGAKRIKTYMSKETGDLYVLMAIQNRDLADSLENQTNILKSKMQEARMTRKAIEEGMKVHNKIIEELKKDSK